MLLLFSFLFLTIFAVKGVVAVQWDLQELIVLAPPGEKIVSVGSSLFHNSTKTVGSCRYILWHLSINTPNVMSLPGDVPQKNITSPYRWNCSKISLTAQKLQNYQIVLEQWDPLDPPDAMSSYVLSEKIIRDIS